MPKFNILVTAKIEVFKEFTVTARTIAAAKKKAFNDAEEEDPSTWEMTDVVAEYEIDKVEEI